MPRWITIRRPFDYRWPDRQAITHYKDPGEQFVKDEVADFAVEEGYATEGKADAQARSRKAIGRRTSRRRRSAAAAKAADSGPDDAVAQPDMADADRPAGRGSVDRDAG